MVHAKFQDREAAGALEDFLTICGHGGHLGHVTKTIFIILCSLFQRRLSHNFGFGLPMDFREDYVLKIMVIYS